MLDTSLTDTQSAQLERANAARREMFGSLMGELNAALSEGDPASAISVCSEVAPSIAEHVGEEHGLRIGRTSFRLRNPANTPPSWAAEAVEQRIGTRMFFAHGDGRFGTLMPIRLMANCLMCHGSRDQLAPGVGEALDELYPDDRATGFTEGELRGWFWVEVPAGRGERDG